MGTRNGVAEPAQNRYPYYHTDCRRPLQPNLAGRSMNPTNHNRTTNLATANLAARVRANSEFYYSDRNTSGILRQEGRGNVLKASLEYYDTVKIRLEMVPWIYRRCYDVTQARTRTWRCSPIYIRLCSLLNSAYKSNWVWKFSVWREEGERFYLDIACKYEEILFGVPGIFIFLFFFLSCKCSRIKMEGFFLNGREFFMAFN